VVRVFRLVIDWLACGRLHPERLVTHRFPVSAFAKAFDAFEHDQTACRKALLSF
jgi:L-gulonate 5-dehydrogenase